MTLRKICVLGLVLAMFVGIMGPGMASADEVSDLQAELAALMATLDGLNAQLAALMEEKQLVFVLVPLLKIFTLV